jgi:dihydroneopterin aldolase
MANTLPASVREPLPTAGTEPLDLIFIEGYTGDTVIGIHDVELHQPQPVVIDLCAGVPRPRACDTDDIRHTIDYGELRTRLQQLLADHGVQLLEGFAEQVAHVVLYEFDAHWVRVRVAKPRKFEDTEAVGVLIERRRAATLESHRAAATLHLIGAGHVPGGR